MEIEKAMQALQNKAMKTVLEAYQKWALFDQVQSAVTELLERSAQDQIGDAKLQSALTHLNDTRLPSLEVVESPQGTSSLRIRNAAFVTEGHGVHESMSGFLGLAHEARTMWSPMRLQEQSRS